MPSFLPQNPLNPVRPDPTLPDWVPPDQNQNPSSGDINTVSNTVSERILTVSPWGRYVPIVFGHDKIGGILTLVQITGNFLYLRLVWCIGEIEEIVAVTLEDGTVPDGAVFTHYTGTASQVADPSLVSIIGGYSDTLKAIGADDYNLAYTVAKVPVASLGGFPQFIAEIKGLKMLSPVPKTTNTTLSSASVTDGDTLSYVGNVITITDNTDGIIGQFIRYNEDELIDGDDYSFTVEVTAISGIGSGDVLVQWCGNSLIDDNTTLQMNINALGTYNGTASFTPYSSTFNYIRFDVTGANVGVSITYEVTLYNTLGNAVAAYSDVAAVAMNHLVTDTQIGLGATSDLTRYVDLINRNSQVLASGAFSESRSAIGLTIDKKAQLSKHIEVLRGYARCTISNQGGDFHYYPLQAQAAGFSLTMADIKPNSLKPVVKDARAIPNIVRVYYTDTYTDPWKDNFIQIETAEVTSGAEYKREAVFRMQGFQSRTAALRFGYDRINERLRTFACKFRTHESVYDKREGETFNLTHPRLGAGTHKMKMFSKKKIAPSEWEVYAELEDDSIYSNEIADYDPDAGTISIEDPFTVTDASGLTLTVETPQYQTAIYFSRLRVVWTASTYNYNFFYKLEFYEDGTNLLLDTQTLNKGITTAVLNNIQENILYRVELSVIGFGGTESTGISDTITPTGKDFPPSDVSSFEGLDLNGTTSFTWSQALDNDGIAYYVIQYGISGFLWDSNDSRILHGRIDALNYTTNIMQAGTYDFLIKAVDTAYNECENATRISDMTINTSPFKIRILTEELVMTAVGSSSSVLSNAIENWDSTSPLPVETDYCKGMNQTWGTIFTNAMNTYTRPLMSYGLDGTTFAVISAEVDVGEIVDAVFTINTYSNGDITPINYDIKAGEIVNVLNDNYNNNISTMSLNDGVNPNINSIDTSIRAKARYVTFIISVTESAVIKNAPIFLTVDAFVKKQYYDETITTGTTTVTFDDPTNNYVNGTVSVNSSSAIFATIDKTPASAPFTGAIIKVWNPDGSAHTSSVDVSGELNYV